MFSSAPTSLADSLFQQVTDEMMGMDYLYVSHSVFLDTCRSLRIVKVNKLLETSVIIWKPLETQKAFSMKSDTNIKSGEKATKMLHGLGSTLSPIIYLLCLN